MYPSDFYLWKFNRLTIWKYRAKRCVWSLKKFIFSTFKFYQIHIRFKFVWKLLSKKLILFKPFVEKNILAENFAALQSVSKSTSGTTFIWSPCHFLPEHVLDPFPRVHLHTRIILGIYLYIWTTLLWVRDRDECYWRKRETWTVLREKVTRFSHS